MYVYNMYAMLKAFFEIVASWQHADCSEDWGCGLKLHMSSVKEASSSPFCFRLQINWKSSTKKSLIGGGTLIAFG